MRRIGNYFRHNLIAFLALFFALGGGAAWAANTIGSADIIDGQVKTADIGDNEVKEADVGQGAVASPELKNNSIVAGDVAPDSLTSGRIATAAVRTDELANGQVQAEDLAPGVAPGASGARAWGLVSSGGSLLRSKSVTAVTPLGNGIYCINPGSGIDPTTAVMVVGEDFTNDSTSAVFDDVSHVEWDSSPSDCPAGTMEVQTFVGDGSPRTFGEKDEGGFNLSNGTQGFTFVIP